MENSKIEWTEHTFNPWWGCAKVSEACRNCYAESLAKRTGSPELWRGSRRRTKPANWNKPARWNAALEGTGRRERVFCASMADVFENLPELVEWRAELWELIRSTPHLDWLLLTKRPECIADMLPDDWGSEGYPNVWLGTTVEDQARADERIPHLLQVPAAVRFLSCEPLIGPVNLRDLPDNTEHAIGDYFDALTGEDVEIQSGVRTPVPARPRVDWVITGGESGHHARPTHPDWYRSIRDQCAEAGVPHLFKQHGDLLAECQVTDEAQRTRQVSFPSPHTEGKTNTYYRPGKAVAGRLLDGRTHDGVPRTAQEHSNPTAA